MKGFVEVSIPPTGNHRNVEWVKLDIGPKGKAPHYCPICKKGLVARVMVGNTDTYRKWKAETVAKLLEGYGAGKFTEPLVLCVRIFGGKGFLESRDWDNVIKCLGDAIVASKVIGTIPGLPALKSGEEREGDDDVRHIKGQSLFYLSRKEHLFSLGVGKPSGEQLASVSARCFVKLVPASEFDPFRL